MPPDSSCGYARAAARGIGDADQAHQLERALARLRLRMPRRRRGASAIWSPTRITGLSAVIGSWKIMRDLPAAQISQLRVPAW